MYWVCLSGAGAGEETGFSTYYTRRLNSWSLRQSVWSFPFLYLTAFQSFKLRGGVAVSLSVLQQCFHGQCCFGFVYWISPFNPFGPAAQDLPFTLTSILSNLQVHFPMFFHFQRFMLLQECSARTSQKLKSLEIHNSQPLPCLDLCKKCLQNRVVHCTCNNNF